MWIYFKKIFYWPWKKTIGRVNLGGRRWFRIRHRFSPLIRTRPPYFHILTVKIEAVGVPGHFGHGCPRLFDDISHEYFLQNFRLEPSRRSRSKGKHFDRSFLPFWDLLDIFFLLRFIHCGPFCRLLLDNCKGISHQSRPISLWSGQKAEGGGAV